MDGPFLYISPRFFLKLFRVFEAYGWPLFVFFTHISWKNGVQTLETPKVEKFVKKRGISRSSDTRDSESRGICEKTVDFTGFSHSRFRKSRILWNNWGFHGIQRVEIPKIRDFRHSRSRKSRIFTFLKLMDGPYFLWSLWMPLLRYGAIHKLNFAFLKLMDGPFLYFSPRIFFSFFSFFAFLKLMDGPFFFQAYGCPFYVMGLSTSYIFAFLKLMDGPFLIF